jgi:hypothetical protein
MKLSDVWRGFCSLSRRKKPGIITFSVQLAVWIVGIAVIIFLRQRNFTKRGGDSDGYEEIARGQSHAIRGKITV